MGLPTNDDGKFVVISEKESGMGMFQKVFNRKEKALKFAKTQEGEVFFGKTLQEVEEEIEEEEK